PHKKSLEGEIWGAPRPRDWASPYNYSLLEDISKIGLLLLLLRTFMYANRRVALGSVVVIFSLQIRSLRINIRPGFIRIEILSEYDW
ncbi:hypothetical protein C0J52_10969, partial [Blattella germanica]